MKHKDYRLVRETIIGSLETTLARFSELKEDLELAIEDIEKCTSVSLKNEESRRSRLFLEDPSYDKLQDIF
jgi:hypothetical protein